MSAFSILVMELIECLGIHMAHFDVGWGLAGFCMLCLLLVFVL